MVQWLLRYLMQIKTIRKTGKNCKSWKGKPGILDILFLQKRKASQHKISAQHTMQILLT